MLKRGAVPLRMWAPGIFSRRMIVPPLGAVYRDGGENRFGRNAEIRAVPARMSAFATRPQVEDSPRLSVVAERLAEVRRRIAQACLEAGRDPGAVTLVAVSKPFETDAIEPVILAGQRVFG